jgi:hypothetical protein
MLVLLGGWFVVTQIVSRSGPPIVWQHDLAVAEQLARSQDRRIFLLLYEPGCKITEANERDLFSLGAVRETLSKMVCCRIELQPYDELRRRFEFHLDPLMLVLKPDSEQVLARLEGKVDRRQFDTFVKPGRTHGAE